MKLRGSHVYLQPLSFHHRNILYDLARDERIWEFNKILAVDENYNASFDDYFNTALDDQALGGQQTFAIQKIADDSIIGMTRLYEINPKEKTAVIGYLVHTIGMGRVYNKECKLLLLQHLFEEMKFNRAELRVAHQNIRSQKAVEKIGAFKEGIFRKHGYRNDGSIRHTVIYSIIDDEWHLVKEKLLRLIAETKND